MARLLFLPDQNWSIASRQDIAAAASATGSAADRQLNLAAEGARVRITLGRDRLGSQLANYVPGAAYSFAVCIWGQGPVDAIESITMGDEPLPSGIEVRHYLGTPGQGVDAPLAAAFAAQGIAYADTLPGIAYSVLQAQSGIDFDPLGIAAIVRGLKAYDPRSGLTAWTNNPSLLLAHVLHVLLGRPVNWASVAACANANDELVGGQPRRRIGLTLSDPIAAETLLETLRTYAACFLVPRADGIHLVPDRAGASVKSIGPGQIISLTALEYRRRADTPTVVTVRYTDTSVLPWVDRVVTVKAPGVDAGTVPWRESELPMPGIFDASQATREATERLNKLQLGDLSGSVTADDTAGDIEPGDVIDLTHDIGLANKPFRVTRIDAPSPGRYTLALAEYDPAVYSSTVVTSPSIPDTRLPSPTAPPRVTALALDERIVQLRDGTFSSGIVASWVPPSLPWIADFRVDVRAAGEVVATGTAARTATSWPSGPLQERVPYQVDVYVRSLLGAESIAASAVITLAGKFLVPGNVPSLSGFEVGGEVRLRWPAAFDIDIWRYEVRWGAVGASWSDATLLDRVDALSLVSKDIPAGTWDFLVCALDSVGQYSPIPARRTIVVSLDAASILVDQHAFSAPAVTGMAEYTLGPDDTRRRWITEDGTLFGSRFSSPLASYTNPLASYSAGSAWQTEAYDFGIALAGNWAGELSISALSGAVAEFLDLSPNGTTWTPYSGLAAKAAARFARLRAATSGAMAVTLPTATVRLDAVARSEEGVVTTAASGPTTVTLSGNYAAVKGLPLVTVSGTSPAYGVVDNIQVGTPTTFDVYAFDASGTQVARQAGWVFKGV